ncbi:MAG: hypothetical protein U5N55_05055 [Cypionkella sp.]|nr:hypothetical protein [Cypionkella sp.]
MYRFASLLLANLIPSMAWGLARYFVWAVILVYPNFFHATYRSHSNVSRLQSPLDYDLLRQLKRLGKLHKHGQGCDRQTVIIHHLDNCL